MCGIQIGDGKQLVQGKVVNKEKGDNGHEESPVPGAKSESVF